MEKFSKGQKVRDIRNQFIMTVDRYTYIENGTFPPKQLVICEWYDEQLNQNVSNEFEESMLEFIES